MLRQGFVYLWIKTESDDVIYTSLYVLLRKKTCETCVIACPARARLDERFAL